MSRPFPGSSDQAHSAHLTGVGLGLRWPFLAEVEQGAARGKVAFFEIAPENYMRRGGYFPETLERIAEHHPIVTHGLMLSLGSPDPLDSNYLRELTGLGNRLHTPWHSDHLTFTGMDGAWLHDLLPIPFSTVMAQRIADRVRRVQDTIGRPVAVENISYYGIFDDNELTEPEFVRMVLDRSGAGLLLDVNNLDVNAKNHGFDATRWLEEIPLERVVEVHVAGPEPWEDGLLLDTHGSDVSTDVTGLLGWVIERTGPLPVLLERDNNIPSLDRLLGEVASIQQVYDEAVTRWKRSLARGGSSHAC